MVDTATWTSQSEEPMPQALTERPMDNDWIRQSFLLSSEAITTTDMVRRMMTTAAFKFTDTTLGGNFAINAPPQFTRYADIKTGGGAVGTRESRRLNWGDTLTDPVAVYHGIADTWRDMRQRTSQSLGMGRYYSEAIDDNAQLVHMRFGVPEFNSLWTFFGGMYDPDSSQLARTGRASLDFLSAPIQSAAGAAGAGVGMLLAAPFYPLVLGGRVLRTLAGWPTTKYYYLKPTMALYWDAVTAICNGLAVNMGLSPYSPADSRTTNYTDQDVFSEKYRSAFAEMLPDVFQKDGLVNIRNIASRAQRLANMYNEKLRDAQGFRIKDLITPGQLRSNLRDYIQTVWDGTSTVPKDRPMTEYLKSYFEASQNKKVDGGAGNNGAAVGDQTQYSPPSAETPPPGALTAGETAGKFWNYLEGDRRDGSDFVTFRVDNPGQASEAFSSTTRESDLASTMNSTSSSMKSKRFSMAEGNIDGAGLLQSATGALQSFAENALAKIQLGGVMALTGLAFVDIPKVWDSSTAQLPRADFNIQLRAWSGDKLSRFMFELVPTAMLMAGTLPLSTGARTYTSPFLCECYSQGRCAIRLGMIESLTIQRGTANVGWTEEHEQMGVDLHFTVVDLSSVMHMPISAGFKLWEKGWLMAADGAGAAADTLAGTGGEGGEDGMFQNAANNVASATTPSTYTDDNSYTDYLAVMGSLSLQQMVYGTRKIALQHALAKQNYKTWNSASRWSSVFMDTLPGRVIRAVSMGTDRDNTR